MQQIQTGAYLTSVDSREAGRRDGAEKLTLRNHPWERPLFVAIAFFSLLVWLAAVASVVLAAYAVFLGIFFYFSHLMFVAYIRGSAVKVTDQQFPELHARLITLTKRMGLKKVPEFYLTQADGSLNALATRFHRSDMIVLFSDLLEACEGNDEACDFIIAHELAHLKARHLRWWLFTTPGRMIPFLGHAYSRACEYTADSWGHAVSGRSPKNAYGLVVLSVGGKLARQVNIARFLEQRKELTGGLMTLGRWLSNYPALSERLAALTPESPAPYSSFAGTCKALAIVALIFIVPIGGFTIAAVTQIGAAARQQSAASDYSAEYADDEVPYDYSADEPVE